MTALALFASTYILVMALGLQSLNVNGGHYRAAFLTSSIIGASNLVLYKLAPDANAIEIAAYLTGGPLGIMAACMDVVVPYLHERKQFGQAIGEFQLMQGKVADLYSTWQATRAYVYAVGRACDATDHARTLRKDAAGAILYSAEKATWMAGEAIQTLGGVGYTNEYPTGRLWRDAKLYEIGAGTSEIRRMLIGRELMAETR